MKRIALPFLPLPLLLAACFAIPARADILYTFALTSSATGQPAGSGSFTLSAPPPTTGTVDYFPSNLAFATPGDYLLTFDITVNNPGLTATFNLQSFFEPYVEFSNGVLSLNAISTQGGTRSQGFYNFQMSATQYTDNFIYFGSNGFPVYTADSGTVVVTPAASATTPEPAALALLATGMLACLARLRRTRTTPAKQPNAA